MKAIIPPYGNGENEIHEVVYIEYQDGVPFSVYTWDVKGNGVDWWDAFLEQGDKNDLRLYNSGGGGQTIQAPHYAEKYKGASYWKHDGVQFNGEPKNIIRLEKPLLYQDYYKKSKNPFRIGEIVYSSQYCNVCERNKKGSGHRTDYCDEHTYTDDNGDLRYFNHKRVH